MIDEVASVANVLVKVLEVRMLPACTVVAEAVEEEDALVGRRCGESFDVLSNSSDDESSE